MPANVVPIITGALGTASKSLKELKEVKGKASPIIHAKTA